MGNIDIRNHRERLVRAQGTWDDRFRMKGMESLQYVHHIFEKVAAVDLFPFAVIQFLCTCFSIHHLLFFSVSFSLSVSLESPGGRWVYAGCESMYHPGVNLIRSHPKKARTVPG